MTRTTLPPPNATAIIAVGNNGEEITLRGRSAVLHPRAALLRYLGRTSARPIYRDKSDGTAVRVGWYIAGTWWAIYYVVPYEDTRS